MAEVVEGAVRINVDPIVAEAVDALGYFHADAITVLANRIARLWGNNAWSLEKDGERVTPFPDRPRYEVSTEIWETMSPKGRLDPTYACKATLLRVSFGVYRARDQVRDQARRAVATEAVFAGVTNYTCPNGRSLDGRTVPLRRRLLGIVERPVTLPSLPLDGCTADWCACRWDFMPDGRPKRR